jgi:hypothetical protein
MKIFANWKTIFSPQEGFIPGVELQSHELSPDNIQFVVDIPEEIMKDEVVAKWIINRGFPVDSATEGMGFEQEWPSEVRNRFDAGEGDRYTWSDL